ncbi:MAG: TIGR03089 family protein [Gordonia sp. (in: high G+C Gram-positive bacteria)]|uniref:TIGR03089 family protein n=1 Tax=Gordonia sp. (in: high G+C Gram-positive bacteria) TaxID=84139 RepID=UPI0039E677BE
MADATVTGAVLGAIGDRARPLLTYYGRDQRIGLSGITLENWAAKIANYLRDEAGVMPGDTVLVDLPEHWQSAAILLGAWWSGARVAVGTDPDALVTFTSIDRAEDHGDAQDLVVVPLDPFAGRVPGLPPHALDFGDTVRPHGDGYLPNGVPAAGLNELSADAVLAGARTAAAGDGITAGRRVLSAREWHTADGIVSNLLAPLVAGAALVWSDDPSTDSLTAIAATEHTDLTLT